MLNIFPDSTLQDSVCSQEAVSIQFREKTPFHCEYVIFETIMITLKKSAPQCIDFEDSQQRASNSGGMLG